MRWFPWALVLFFLANPALAAEPKEKEWDVIRVMAGGQLDFKTPTAVQRVAVGDASIADVSVLSKRNLLILGKKTGVTTLLLWANKTGQPRMYRVQVDQALPGKTPATGAAAHLTAEGAPVIVHGEMQDALQHEMALRMAEQVAGEKGAVIDRSTIPLSGQVMVDVRFVEMSKKVLNEAGINLVSHPQSQNGIRFGMYAPGALDTVSNFLNGGSLPIKSALNLVASSASPSGALGVLSLLENNGLARTLAQPSMTVVSGQTASFMAGGEYPIPVAQSLGQVTITYKPYGIRLALTPTVFSKNRIAIKLAPEVSELDFTNAVTLSGLSVPGVLTRRAETTIELGDGESFVIAGLISRTFVDAVDKVPGLGDVPVLGAFFKSTRFTREDKELVIIATPRLVRPIAANAEQPPLPGAEYDQYNPGWMRRLFYGGDMADDESVGLSR